MAIEKATLGGGCFWCVEAAFQMLNGVSRVVSGYANGSKQNPTYQEVCTGTTGHAEVVQIDYDPEIVSYGEILQLFFSIHDPTTLNRQGNDVGTQYRSTILYHNDRQKAEAERVIQTLNVEEVWPDPIVTTVEPLDTFYEAEAYHQDFYNQNPSNQYCQIMIKPKIEKLKQVLK